MFLCSIWNDCCIDVGGSDYGMKLLLSNANCENHDAAFITVHAYIPITIEWLNTDLIQAFPFLRTHVLWSINAHQWKDSYRISQYCQNALKPNGQKKLYKMYRYKKKVSMMTPYCVNIEVYEYHVENGRNWMAQWSQRAAQSIPGTRKTIQNVAWSISGTRKKNPLALTACKVLGTDNKITSPYLWSTKILGWTIKSADFWVVIYFLQEFDCLNLSCSDQWDMFSFTIPFSRMDNAESARKKRW